MEGWSEAGLKVVKVSREGVLSGIAAIHIFANCPRMARTVLEVWPCPNGVPAGKIAWRPGI